VAATTAGVGGDGLDTVKAPKGCARKRIQPNGNGCVCFRPIKVFGSQISSPKSPGKVKKKNSPLSQKVGNYSKKNKLLVPPKINCEVCFG
jgi:hypothetical protein